MSMSKT